MHLTSSPKIPNFWHSSIFFIAKFCAPVSNWAEIWAEIYIISLPNSPLQHVRIRSRYPLPLCNVYRIRPFPTPTQRSLQTTLKRREQKSLRSQSLTLITRPEGRDPKTKRCNSRGNAYSAGLWGPGYKWRPRRRGTTK